ncbi:hypothetical protein SAMN04489761_3032 [Tenacibaculum sp. MAR_2009_124]|nr:hypothetical protein SAMN04489761_3032 [Tenacibaculum sp. MAR_2009_124]
MKNIKDCASCGENNNSEHLCSECTQWLNSEII